MSLLFPAMLGGLLGLAVPIALHLIAKHRFPIQEFPAIRLLRRDLRTNVFAPRLVDVPQLLLRILVIGLLVAAMARIFSPGGSSGDAPRNLVIVIDGSAGMRMQYLDETTKTKTTFAVQAKKEARAILEKLNASSQCAVLFAGESARVAAPLQQGTQAALQSLDGLDPVDGSGCGLVKAIADACTLVSGRREAVSQVVVLTDMRANAFTQRDQRDLQQIEHIRKEMGAALKIVLVDLADKRELNNLAIVDAHIRGQSARVGDDAHVVARVMNSSKQAQTARMNLQIGDRKEPATKDIPLEAGTEAVVDLTARVQRAVNTVATAKIGEDDLAFDNSFNVPLNISDTRRILLINGGSQGADSKNTDLTKLGGAPTTPTTDDDGKLDGATILRFVLNPGRELGGASGTGIETTLITPDALSGQTLSKYDLIALYDVSALPDPALEDLTTYVTEGRALLMICAGNTQALNFNRVFASGTAKRPALSPVVLGNDKALEQPIDIQFSGSSHPLLAPFQDRLKGDLSVIRFTKVREIQSQLDGTSILLTAQSGQPLALEHPVGRGKAVLLTVGFELDRGNIARARAFPALVWRLTDYLTGRLRQRAPDVVPALQPAVLDVSEPAFAFVNEVELNPEMAKGEEKKPGEKPSSVRMASSTDKTALMPALPSGKYLLSKATSGNETVRVGYSRYVTTFVDPAESDTRRADNAEVSKLLAGETPVITVADAPSLALSGSELWRSLVLALAVAYLAEALLGYVLTKRKEKERSLEEARA